MKGEPRTVRELFFYLQGDFLNALDEKIKQHAETCEVKTRVNEHCRDHKKNFWRILSLAVGVPSGIFAALKVLKII